MNIGHVSFVSFSTMLGKWFWKLFDRITWNPVSWQEWLMSISVFSGLRLVDREADSERDPAGPAAIWLQ